MTDNNNKNNQTNNYSVQSHLANNIVTHSGPVHLGLYLDPNDYDYEFNFYSEEEFTQDRAFPLQQTTEETQSDVEERENEKEKEVNENEDAMESLEAVEKVNNQVETANKQAPLPFLQKTTNFEQDNEGRPPQETPIHLTPISESNMLLLTLLLALQDSSPEMETPLPIVELLVEEKTLLLEP